MGEDGSEEDLTESPTKMANILKEELENGNLANVNGMKESNVPVIELENVRDRNFTLNSRSPPQTKIGLSQKTPNEFSGTLNDKLINLDIIVDDSYIEDLDVKQYNVNSTLFKK